MQWRQLFTEHPASVGESYTQHLCTACGFSFRMLGGAIACLLHGVLPFLFKRAGSDCIADLHDRMITQRSAASTRITGTSPAR